MVTGTLTSFQDGGDTTLIDRLFAKVDKQEDNLEKRFQTLLRKVSYLVAYYFKNINIH